MIAADKWLLNWYGFWFLLYDDCSDIHIICWLSPYCRIFCDDCSHEVTKIMIQSMLGHQPSGDSPMIIQVNSNNVNLQVKKPFNF